MRAQIGRFPKMVDIKKTDTVANQWLRKNTQYSPLVFATILG
jgi:hypothetical protein